MEPCQTSLFHDHHGPMVVSRFFYSCLSLVPSRMGDLCPVLMGPCGYFSMGIHPNPASLHAISALYSSSPAQTQLHTNLDLHVHQHLGWEGRRGQIIQFDQTDNLPALVLKCQGHPSHFATSAGQIECPSRYSRLGQTVLIEAASSYVLCQGDSADQPVCHFFPVKLPVFTSLLQNSKHLLWCCSLSPGWAWCMGSLHSEWSHLF